MVLSTILFYGLAAMLVGTALMVILSRNPVRSALFLVASFLASAGLWLLLEAEFLALVLVLVYVGAVMTLFLFVVMTIKLKGIENRMSFVKFLPVGVAVVGVIVGLLIYAIGPEELYLNFWYPALQHPAGYSNVAALGNVLYTEYVYPFELAAVLLLIAIVAGISLAFRGIQPGTKSQEVRRQIGIQREQQVKLAKVVSASLDSGVEFVEQKTEEGK